MLHLCDCISGATAKACNKVAAFGFNNSNETFECNSLNEAYRAEVIHSNGLSGRLYTCGGFNLATPCGVRSDRPSADVITEPTGIYYYAVQGKMAFTHVLLRPICP